MLTCRRAVVPFLAVAVALACLAAPAALAQSTPKECFDKLNGAVEKKDVKLMASCFVEPYASMFEKILPHTEKLMAAQKKLAAAVDAKYGAGTAKEMYLEPPDEQSMMPFEGKAELLELKEEGDKATGKIKYTKEGQTEEKPVEFRKKDGAWKIVPPGEQEKDPAQLEMEVKQMEQMIGNFPKMVAAMEKLAAEVEQGKYATKMDFQMAYGQAMMQAMMGGEGGTGEPPPSEEPPPGKEHPEGGPEHPGGGEPPPPGDAPK